jgi:ElaB/YqjD/DUF883 family membrane-anchored ribosome-binding protein
MANPSHTKNDPKGGGASGGMMETAKEVTKQVGDKADQATAAAGRGMQSVAGTIRENAPQEGMIGGAAQAVSSTIESGGRYLADKQISGMADDLTQLIRNNPVPALLIAAGVGFLLARAMARD